MLSSGSPQTGLPATRPLKLAALTTLLVLPVALFGLRLQDHGVGAFWPAAGVGTGLMILGGRASRPAIAVGITVALAIADLTQARSMGTALVLIAGNIAETLLVAIAIDRLADRPFLLDRLRHVALLVAASLAVPALVGLFVGMTLPLAASGTSRLFEYWRVWTGSHAVGIITVVPAMLLLARPRRSAFALGDLAQTAAVAVAATVVVGEVLPEAGVGPLLALVLALPLGLWFALNASDTRAALSLAAIAGVTIWQMTSQSGLFANDTDAAVATLIAIAVVLLTLGALRSEPAPASWVRRWPRLGDQQAAMVLVPLMLFAIVSWLWWHGHERDAFARAARVASNMAEHANHILASGQSMADAALALAARDGGSGSGQLRAMLSRLHYSAAPKTSVALVAAGTGTVISDTSQNAPADSGSVMPDIVRAHAGKAGTVIGVPDVGASAGAVFTVSTFDPDLGLVAVVRLPVSLFLEVYASLLDDPRDVVTLSRADGMVLARQPPLPMTLGQRIPSSTHSQRYLRNEVAATAVSNSVLDGRPRIASVSRVGELPAVVYYGLDLARVRADWLKQIAPLGLMFLIGSGLLLVLASRARRAETAAETARFEVAAQEALRKSEEQFRLLFEQSIDGIFVANLQGRYLDVNSSGAGQLGLTRDEVLNRSIADVIAPEERQRIAGEIDQLAAGVATRGEWRFLRGDGSSFIGEVVARKLPDGSLMSILRDITERRAGEALLRESEARLRLANEAAGIGTFAIDVASGIAHYSPELAEMLGFSGVLTAGIEQAFGRVHRDDVKRVRAQFLAALDPRKGDGRLRMDFRFVRPGGVVRWMTWNGRVEFAATADGRRFPAHIIGACADLTERKEAEAMVLASEERLRTIVNTAVDAIIVVDERGTIQSVNPASERIFRYTAGALAGRSLGMLLDEIDRAALDDIFAAYTQASAPSAAGTGREVIALTADGDRFESELSIVGWRMGGRRFFTAIMRDITARKQHEAEIRLLLAELNHRAKNLLGVVQAIAKQTADKSPDAFFARFSERLEGLAASQDLLVDSQWHGISLETLARVQLAHYADLIGGRITLAGPALRIAASAVQTLGMALHELATNAGKYGALSDTAGRINVTWGLESGAHNGKIFTIRWTEQGGPKVVPPNRRGFGTTVISDMPRMSLDAAVTLDFAASGLVWRLSCPAQLMVEPGDLV